MRCCTKRGKALRRGGIPSRPWPRHTPQTGASCPTIEASCQVTSSSLATPTAISPMTLWAKPPLRSRCWMSHSRGIRGSLPSTLSKAHSWVGRVRIRQTLGCWCQRLSRQTRQLVGVKEVEVELVLLQWRPAIPPHHVDCNCLLSSGGIWIPL